MRVLPSGFKQVRGRIRSALAPIACVTCLSGAIATGGCSEGNQHAGDAGVRMDGSTATDAEARPEAGPEVYRDATAAMDAATTRDAAGDAAMREDAAAPSDASPPADTGTLEDAAIDADAGAACDAGCPDQHDRCVAGRCKPVICHDEYECFEGSVYQCLEQGTARALYLACDQHTQACERSTDGPRCVFACTPGEPICLDDLLTACQDDGRSLATGGTDCSAGGETCDPVEARCAAKLCEPHTTYCKGGNVYQCTRNGAAEVLFATCVGSQYCRQEITSAYCAAPVCSPGQAYSCDGTIARLCNAQGSGADTSTGTDCATLDNQHCVDGTCIPCGDGWHPVGNACVPDVCPKAAPACVENRITTCDAHGSAFNPGGKDCSATSEICDQQLHCASEAVDTLGSPGCAGYAVKRNGLAEHYQVSSARHLTKIEAALGYSGSGSLTWFVYESSDASQFTKVLETTRPISGDGSVVIVDSGTIAAQLDAGKQYIIGVAGLSELNVCYPEEDDGAILMTSFGQHLQSIYIYPETPPATLMEQRSYPGSHSYQRLTTVP